MNVPVGVILTCKMIVSEVLYWTTVGPIGDSKPTHSRCSNVIVGRLIFYGSMQPTLYSDDSTSCSEHLTPVVHLTVVSCCARMASCNGESGIGQAAVCNNWRCVRDIISPLIGHTFPRWLWVYEAGEIHDGSNGVWTTGRICDHSHHRICMESHFISHNQNT